MDFICLSLGWNVDLGSGQNNRSTDECCSGFFGSNVALKAILTSIEKLDLLESFLSTSSLAGDQYLILRAFKQSDARIAC